MILRSSLPYRPEINGLRGVSVLMVLIYHFFPSYLRSGFIGVDIFFVISGYLIIQLLCKESLSQHNALDFLKSRYLRLSPSFLLVLLSVLVVGWFFLLIDEYLDLSKATLSSLLFQSNLYELTQSGYFQSTLTMRPLLHLWSLSVEIQFYIFMVFFIKYFKSSKYLIEVICALIFFSFFINVVFLEKIPTSVFFLSIFRFWEILLGSLIALLQRKKVLSGLFSYLGVILLIVAVIFTHKYQFPGYVALLAVGGACCLVINTRTTFITKLLKLRPLVFIGVISYSLYLWHWPILEITKIIYGDLSVATRLCILILSFFLAVFTTYLVERPIRKNKSYGLLHLTYAVLLFFSLSVYFMGLGEGRSIDESNSVLKSKNSLVLNYKNSCSPLLGMRDNEHRCNFNGYVKDKTNLVVIGDSQSNAFSTILSGMQKYQRFNYLQLGKGMCPSLIGYGDQLCRDFSDRVANYIVSDKSIHNVVIATQWPLYSEGLKVNNDFFDKDAFWDALSNTVRMYKKAGKSITVVYSVPLGAQPRQCFKRTPFRRSGCNLSLSEAKANEKKYRYNLDKIVIENNLKSIDLTKYLCSNIECLVMKNDNIFYLDSSHLSELGGAYIAEMGYKDVLNGVLSDVKQ